MHSVYNENNRYSEAWCMEHTVYIREQTGRESGGEGRGHQTVDMEPRDDTHKSTEGERIETQSCDMHIFFAFFFLFVTVHVYIIVSFVQIQAVSFFIQHRSTTHAHTHSLEGREGKGLSLF